MISKASATQRAGRVGRTKPGTVFRMYAKNRFNNFQEHETAEIHRVRHENMIVTLQNTLEDTPNFAGLSGVLRELVEPPKMDAIDQSFEVLYGNQFFTAPGDTGRLTVAGRIAGRLPVDINHSRAVLIGVTLGVGLETAVMVTSLSLAHSLFRTTSHFVQKDPDELNKVAAEIYFKTKSFDGGSYSDQILNLKLLAAWLKVSPNNRVKWAYDNCIAICRGIEEKGNQRVMRMPRDFGSIYFLENCYQRWRLYCSNFMP